MFDLAAGKAVHIPQRPLVPMLVSIAAQATLVTVLVIVPILFVTDQLPAPSTMMAFVAAAPPPPPPPPAPAPSRAESVKPVPTTDATAPVEEPSRLEPEPPSITDVGFPGGVEGGIIGGVVGGSVDGFEIEAPPPPPPPPRVPVRTGGNIQPPALVKRIEPIYPELAVRAHLEGTVILEAIVNEDGRVEGVKVLRSVGMLDRAAMEAVQQWIYEPLTLNGRKTPFILTVVLTFALTA